jgi:hypothetical protein
MQHIKSSSSVPPALNLHWTRSYLFKPLLHRLGATVVSVVDVPRHERRQPILHAFNRLKAFSISRLRCSLRLLRQSDVCGDIFAVLECVGSKPASQGKVSGLTRQRNQDTWRLTLPSHIVKSSSPREFLLSEKSKPLFPVVSTVSAQCLRFWQAS